MDHDKSEMTSETEEKENASASDGKGSRPHGETDLTGNNSEGNETAPILQMSQHIFVADTLEDDESMIIPPTQEDTVPFMVPSTPAYEKKSSKREVDPNESTVSVLEETCVDLENKSDLKNTSADDGKGNTACNESDLTQDLEDMEPTQPIIPTNFMEFPPDDVKNTEEEEDDDDWQLKFSESQTQDILNFNNNKEEEPDVFPAKESSKPIEEKDEDDLPPTQSIEAPRRIDDSIYDNSLKTIEPSKNIETVDIQSDDEIEPSQSCLLEYKGETISSPYKIQPSKSPRKEMPNDEVSKLQSEVELNLENSIRDDTDIEILCNADQTTISLSETARTINLSETRSLDDSKAAENTAPISVENTPVPCVDVGKTKIEDNAVNDIEKSVNKFDIEAKLHESKSFTESPQKNCDKKVIETIDTNGSQVEESMTVDDKNIEKMEVDLDKSTKHTEEKSPKSDVISNHELATMNSDDHNETATEDKNLESTNDNCKIPDEVTKETDENKNEVMEIDEKEEVSEAKSKEVSCNVKNIEVIQDTSKEVESSDAVPLQKPESSTLTTSEKLVTDRTAPKSDAALDQNVSKEEEPDVQKSVKSIVDPDPIKLEGGNSETKQTTDDKFISPSSSFLMGPPKSTERSFSRQKYQNKTVFRDVSSIESKRHLGSFKNIASLQKLLKRFNITLSNEHLNTVLLKPNDQIDLNCVYTLENWNLSRTIQFEHHRQDSGVSPISSSSTTTSSAISSKNSGEMADCSSLSSDKSNNSCRISQSINILSSQDSALEIFPKTSTQKSPETQGFFTTFGDNGVAGQFKPESPIKTEQKAKAATPKRKRGKKNSESSSVSESPRKNGPKRKRAKELKAVVENKSEETDESKDAVVEAKPRKPTRRKKGQPINPEIQLEVVKATYEAIPTSTEDDSSTQDEESNFGSILPGVKVMARWKDGYYYSGEVKCQEGDGRWAVMFDDKVLRTITSENLIKIAILAKGTSVMVLSPDDYYDPGIVCGHFREGNRVGYEVELDNGVTRRYERHHVILSADQAKLIISSRPPTTPATMTINLDNIVDGKRKRKSVQSPVASPVLKKSPRITRSKKPDPILDSTAESSATEVLSDKSEEPVAKKKKRGTKANKNLDTDDAKSTTSSSTSCLSTKALRQSPVPSLDSTAESSATEVLSDKSEEPVAKKKKKETKANTNLDNADAKATPSTSTSCKTTKALPQRSTKKLFKDYAFLLTNADRKKPLDSSESEESEIVPFDKDELCAHIASGGGIVLEKFDDIKKCNRKHIYLLANSYLRTMKYIQCIAAGISCIKHHWVQNCIFKGEILSLNSYILPSGFSLVSQQVVEWHGKTDVFEGFKIALVSAHESSYVCTWAPVLLAAKADFVQKWSLPSSVSGCSIVIDVLITNNLCPPKIIESAVKRQIPIVSSEWIIQCLIMGEKLPFDAHPKFKHDYTEM